MAQKSKALVAKKKGVLCYPQQKTGNPLSESIKEKVESFYVSDEISRQMGGARDFVSVKEGSQRVQRQKRLVLGNLKEIYSKFNEQHSDLKIGFSKFADLRAKHCVLAGESGTHSVCVCAIHQNFKLMFEGAIYRQTRQNETEYELQTYKDCLGAVMCDDPTQECSFGQCCDCPGVQVLRDKLTHLFETEFVDSVSYKQWLTVDRCSLETVLKSVPDFLDEFLDYVPRVIKHDFIAKKQAEYLKSAKATLSPTEIVVIADLSENYSFVLQDSVQGQHWNNTQATVHPFAGYYKSSAESDVATFNFVIISDCMDHDTAAVYTFQRRLIDYIKKEFPKVRKIKYFSDGAASQYKNKFNVANLANHQSDFSVQEEWHYFATSHGKGPSDSLGGTLKREAARASLILPIEEQIQTPLQLYAWAEKALPGVNVCFVENEEVQSERENLKKRFDNDTPITGIRSFHCVLPKQPGYVEAKTHSSLDQGQLIKLNEYNDEIEKNTIQTRAMKRKRQRT